MIIRTEKGECPFAQIDRAPLEDARLSWRAKGILAYLLSKPSGWTVRADDLLKKGTEGRDAVRAAMGELRDCGYAELRMMRGAGGEATGKEWIIHERPNLPKDGKTENQAFRPIREKELDSNKEKTRKRAVSDVVTATDLAGYVLPECLRTEDFALALEEWRMYRSVELKKPLTRPMLNRLLQAAIQKGAALYAVDIRFSIEATWRGIFPAKPVNGTQVKRETKSGEWGKPEQGDYADARPMTEEDGRRIKEGLKAHREGMRGGPRSQGGEPKESQYSA